MSQQICSHADYCGGCSYQDMPYDQQLAMKQSQVEAEVLGIVEKEKILPITASPVQYFYRNKMEYTFSRDIETKKIILGLHSSQKRKGVFDMQECNIFSANTQKICSVFTDYATEKGLSFYSVRGHKGFLRYLVLRRSISEKSIMINFVFTSQGEFDKEFIKEKLLSLQLENGEKITSLYYTKSDSLSDAVVPEQTELYWGNEFLSETIKGVSYKIYPYTFFQVNPAALDGFYDKLRALADLRGNENVLDLYCGVGTISLMLASKAKKVYGIEFSEDSVLSAKANAIANSFENCEFFAGDAGKILKEKKDYFGKLDLLVVNPPRAGIMPKAVEEIIETDVEQIIYSSCNIKTMAENLKQFSAKYDIVSLQAYDFFPHTKHFENLALLKKREK